MGAVTSDQADTKPQKPDCTVRDHKGSEQRKRHIYIADGIIYGTFARVVARMRETGMDAHWSGAKVRDSKTGMEECSRVNII